MTQRFFLTLGLLIVFAVAACAPALTPPPAAATQPQAEVPTAAPTITPAVLPLTAAPVPTASPLPVATSRGPNLEATDPTTVNLAAGQLQLVEFFRFT